MDLRYRLAVVTDAGAGLGREVAVALSRLGASVLAADRDLAAAEATAALVGDARVQAWALQVDTADEQDLQMLAARSRDLGGTDLLVALAATSGAASRLTELFLAGLPERRGRRDGSPAAVTVHGRPDLEHVGSSTLEARLMCVVPDDAPVAETARAVVDLLCRGTSGEVVELSSRARPRTT